MPTGSVLIIALICAALGYLTGLIITRMNSSRTTVDHPTPEKEIDPGGVRFVAHRLNISLWSKTPQGLLLADVNGRTVNSPKELGDSERKQIETDLQTVQAWFGTKLAIIENQPAKVAPVENEVLEVDKPDEELYTPTAADDLPFISDLVEPTVRSSAAVEHSAMTPAQENAVIQTILKQPQEEAVKPVPAKLDLNTKARPAAPQPKSLVEQIDEVLQEKVAVSPFADSGIKLSANPQGGVEVWIGKQIYPGVDVVPDGAEKQLILQAIREWEKK